ncbi:hypothetical protein RFF05_01810 [Bengtsoniella intestinalis]
MEEGDGDALYAHYALHHLGILPSTLMALPLQERGFIYASIDRALAQGV